MVKRKKSSFFGMKKSKKVRGIPHWDKVLLSCLLCMSLSAEAAMKSQISVKLKNASLKQAMEQIAEQCDVHFTYSKEVIDINTKVTLDCSEENLEDALDKMFAYTNISYKIAGDKVYLTKEAKAKSNQSSKKTKITGVVLDSSGETIIGANVFIKGTQDGVITDADGWFTINAAPGDILTITYIGYKPKDVKIGDKVNLKIILEEDTKKLDEVVIVGYGQQKKESVVVAMSSVKPSEIATPTRNLTNSLAGQVSGLIAVQRSGEPGYDDAEFWIRGVSTFAGGTKPLVLVDGVPRKMNDIEPDEIETFSVLKDASATAIYGAEGANGVILITTKRGKNEKARITFKTEHSFSTPTRLPEFVGSADYLQLFNEALSNDGELPMFTDEQIENYRIGADNDLYPNTNWTDALLKKHTSNHRYTLNVRGGTEKAKYFVSGAYYNESGLFKGDANERYNSNIGVNRFNLRSNIDMQVSKTTGVTVDLAGQYLVNNFPGTGTSSIFRSMLITPPHVFPAVYSDGTVATYPQERDSNMRNPYNLLMNSGYAKEFRTGIQSKVGLRQDLNFITNGLTLTGNISYDYDGVMIVRRAYNPSRYFATGRDENGKLIFNQVVSGQPDLQDPTNSSNASTKKIYIDAALTYKRTFNEKHDVGAMLLYNQREHQTHDVALPFRKQGLVGRGNYGYDDRYFVEVNFGYSGSETFAKGHRFGFFPSVGLAYYLSNEAFFPAAIKEVVGKLKLRGSYGKTGNDDTGGSRFLYRPTYTMNGGGFNQGITDNGGSNGIGNGIYEGRFEAPRLSWEIEEKQNYGFEMGLFNNQIDFVIDYFRSERSNILLRRKTVPQLGGFREDPWQNFGKVMNQGVDMSLNANHNFGPVKVGFRGTFTFTRNKVLEYDELPQKYQYQAVTGTRVNENTLFIADRLYKDEDFIIKTNAAGKKTYTLKPELPQSTLGGMIAPGDIKYVDVNGDGVIDSYDKVRGVGNPSVPEIVYGFGLNVEYKNFYASVFFQGVGNTSVLLGGATPEGWYPFAWGVDQSNFRTFALDRWTEENPSQDVLMPRLHKSNLNNRNNTQASTWWLRNGSFLRLKNLEIGYNVPQVALKKIGFQAARIYMMGYNVAVWDHIKFFDPEAGNANAGMNYPLPRTFTIGLDFTF